MYSWITLSDFPSKAMGCVPPPPLFLMFLFFKNYLINRMMLFFLFISFSLSHMKNKPWRMQLPAVFLNLHFPCLCFSTSFIFFLLFVSCFHNMTAYSCRANDQSTVTSLFSLDTRNSRTPWQWEKGIEITSCF